MCFFSSHIYIVPAKPRISTVMIEYLMTARDYQLRFFEEKKPSIKLLGGKLRLGTSGFSFPDWKGPVYPAGLPDSQMLSYYEQSLGFPTVEVNYTYYRQPYAKTMAGMVAKTSSYFDFSVKANRLMTHEIWADKERTKFLDNKQAFADFRSGLKPMVEAGRLGAVLAQFPSYFFPTPASYKYLEYFRDQLGKLSLVVEFRNSGWLKDGTYKFLTKNKMGFCCVDEPQLPRLLPLVIKATSDIGYIRFHGRNKEWYTAKDSSLRYNYDYSAKELNSFIPLLKELAGQTKKTYAFFNNCHAGQAAQNAEQLARLII